MSQEDHLHLAPHGSNSLYLKMLSIIVLTTGQNLRGNLAKLEL